MLTVYLDHNIVHYFVRGFLGSDAAEREALTRAMNAHPGLRIVVSDWNFLEPCWESDKETGQLPLIDRYSTFLENLKPLYLPTVIEIKRAEMARLVFHQLGLPDTARPINVFNETFSQARVVSGLSEVLLGHTARDFMRYLIKHPPELQKYKSAQQTVLNAQLTIQRARATGQYQDPSIQQRIWREWFASMLPDRGPDNRFIERSRLQPLLDQFVTDPAIVLSACPAIRAESLLSDARANTGGRNPQMTDAIDLMHSVPALAYCDAFVCNDGFVRECAKRVLKQTKRPMIVDKSLEASLDALGVPSAQSGAGTLT